MAVSRYSTAPDGIILDNEGCPRILTFPAAAFVSARGPLPVRSVASGQILFATPDEGHQDGWFLFVFIAWFFAAAGIIGWFASS